MASLKPDLWALRKELTEPTALLYRLCTADELTAELEAAGVDVAASLASIAAERQEREANSPPKPPRKPRGRPRKEPAQEWQEPVQRPPLPPRGLRDPNELPGQRLNTNPHDQPIRVDDEGRIWYQEEVRKPAYPKPRGRRVLKYLDTGVRVETVQNGEYVESFEVAGVGEARPAEVKITLPSYQVGIYKDPRFDWRIHCYDGRQGFDLLEIQDYFEGAERVPNTVKRIYVENDLCYDIRSVVQTIEDQLRHLQLTGRIPNVNR